MPLLDVTYGDPCLVEPDYVENLKLIQALKIKMNGRRFNRIIKTIDEAVDSIVKHPNGKITTDGLSWAKTGSLFGHQSMQPKKRVDHLWSSVARITGYTKELLMAVGSLLRWRIALRDEMWLLYRRDTDLTDPDTNKVVTVSEYWITDKDMSKYL
ncbi:MAG: hypothetical protein GF411_00965 [Candidatus Lokiarchaeota archaeon]|nr:hypothetical protein [Candidatus Lokiarchaeota archaeon]